MCTILYLYLLKHEGIIYHVEYISMKMYLPSLRTVKSLWSYLAQQGVDVSELWGRLEDLVVKTLVSGESAISALVREHVSSTYSCYELFGVDVLLDQNLRPWLLEVSNLRVYGLR